jgi:hypothetical protein
MALHRRKEGNKLEVRTIMGKSNHCRNPKHGNVQNQEGSRKQEGQNCQHAETKTKTLWRWGRPTRQRQGRTGTGHKGKKNQGRKRTQGRRRKDKEDEKNKKRYNLRKRIGRTVYVSASKIFRLDNLRDTDNVIKAMKRGYEVSIGGSFFAGSKGSTQMGQQDGTGNQHDDQERDDDKRGPQPEQDQ